MMFAAPKVSSYCVYFVILLTFRAAALAKKDSTKISKKAAAAAEAAEAAEAETRATMAAASAKVMDRLIELVDDSASYDDIVEQSKEHPTDDHLYRHLETICAPFEIGKFFAHVCQILRVLIAVVEGLFDERDCAFDAGDVYDCDPNVKSIMLLPLVFISVLKHFSCYQFTKPCYDTLDCGAIVDCLVTMLANEVIWVPHWHDETYAREFAFCGFSAQYVLRYDAAKVVEYADVKNYGNRMLDSEVHCCDLHYALCDDETLFKVQEAYLKYGKFDEVSREHK